tara:strand:+ start:553 stop:1242 length:690 start_codon:yes stop_codon:yes gene_type:complete
MSDLPFILFGQQHLFALVLSALIIVYFPLYAKKKLSNDSQEAIAKTLAIFLIIHELSKPFYRPYFFGDELISVIPLHACNLSGFFIATYLLTRKKVFFEVAYYWGLGGGIMALLTPDLVFAFPDIEWFPFFIGHGAMIMAIFFSMFCHNTFPTKHSYRRVVVITLSFLPVIYIINILLGPPANYWYLNTKPEGDSLMNIMPSPPFHIPIAMGIAFAVFYLLHIPFRKKL